MSSDYNPPQDPLKFLHDDHEVVLVDKPAGLLSVPGKGPELTDCLIKRVQAVFPTALLVHRLDRDTSGVMIFALTPHAQRHLERKGLRQRALDADLGDTSEALNGAHSRYECRRSCRSAMP